jgi:hypothetical protein
MKKIGGRLLAEIEGEILLAHQTLDFSYRNALKTRLQASIISKKSFRGCNPRTLVNKSKREGWEGKNETCERGKEK